MDIRVEVGSDVIDINTSIIIFTWQIKLYKI